MENFYKFLSKKRIDNEKNILNFVFKQPIKKIIELNRQCSEIIFLNQTIRKDTKNKEHTVFDFSANSSLSGSSFPCRSIQCRIKKAKNLSIFSALYANSILIPNFFSKITTHKKIKNPEAEHIFRNEIAGNIIVYLAFKPLINKGFIHVNPGGYRICNECLKKLTIEEKKLNKKIKIIASELERLLSKKLKYKLKRGNYLAITGSEDYLEHGYQGVKFSNLPSSLKKYAKRKSYIFSPSEVQKNKLAQLILKNNLDDLTMQKWSFYGKDLTYLTNKQVDKDIIDLVNKNKKEGSPSLFDGGLNYSLPFFQNIDIKKALKLREVEQESFQIFQIAIKNALDEAKKSKGNKKELQDIFQDIAMPEVFKINSLIKRNKKYIIDKALGESVYNLGLISIGCVFDWTSIALLGGCFTTKELYEDLIKYFHIPPDGERNDFYFLWKLKNK